MNNRSLNENSITPTAGQQTWSEDQSLRLKKAVSHTNRRGTWSIYGKADRRRL